MIERPNANRAAPSEVLRDARNSLRYERATTMSTKRILGLDVLDVKLVHICRITPDDARRLLEFEMENNRKSSVTVVNRYARDMQAGHWESETNEPLGFIDDERGLTLIDGGNRLRALIQANVTVDMPIMVGCKTHMGVGWIRRAEQVLNIMFDTCITKWEVETTKCILAARNEFQPSPLEVRDCYLANIEAIQFSEVLFSSHVRTFTQAPIRAIFARAYYHEDHDALRAAATTLITGKYSSEAGETIVALRNSIEYGVVNTFSGSRKRAEIHRRAERALQAYCAGEKLSKIYPATGELYPLPEESPQV